MLLRGVFDPLEDGAYIAEADDYLGLLQVTGAWGPLGALRALGGSGWWSMQGLQVLVARPRERRARPRQAPRARQAGWAWGGAPVLPIRELARALPLSRGSNAPQPPSPGRKPRTPPQSRVWPLLGVSPAMHNSCFAWIHFRQVWGGGGGRGAGRHASFLQRALPGARLAGLLPQTAPFPTARPQTAPSRPNPTHPAPNRPKPS